MNTRTVLSMLALAVVPMAQGSAQVVSTEVTVTAPVDLTQLSPDITKVRVDCVIQSDAITNGNQFKEITKSQEIPVTGGALKTTASIVFALTNLDNPVGKNATAGCSLWGWSQPGQKWAQFHPAQSDPAFKTNTTVGLSTKAFVW